MTEIEKAAELLREKFLPTWFEFFGDNIPIDLQREVADAVSLLVVEHRPDDSLPIDEAWLRSAGFDEMLPEFNTRLWSYRDNLGCCRCRLFDDPGWEVEFMHYRHGTAKLHNNTTRGQLRQVCRALGISLKE